ncbi:MAG: hypothetical protein ABJF88_10635 [Rhodothermales bacterium]
MKGDERKRGRAEAGNNRGGGRDEGLPLFHTSALPLLALLALLALSTPARAQVLDSAAVADSLVVPADTLVAPVDSLGVPADTTARRRPSPLPVGFAGPEPGLVAGSIPARAPVFHAAALLGERPGAFHYDLGVPGWADGVAFGGLAPRRTALSLDGVPATDLFSGRPAFELLPLDVLAPLRLGPRYGSPVGVAMNLRAYAAAVPVTELRYRTGGDGLQFISATHAQTRRPGWVRRLGGDRARLQALFHVSGRESDRDFAGFDGNGWQALGRIGIALPAFSFEVTERHGRDRVGAPGGTAPTGGDFDTALDPDLATVLDPSAERETIRNDLAATLRLPLLADPLTATAFWTAETFRYIDPTSPTDTLETRGDRTGLRVVQPLRIGLHRLRVQAEGWVEEVDPGAAFTDESAQSTLHLTVQDSLAVAGFDLDAEAGLHTGAEASFPSLGLRVERAGGAARAFASARYGGATVGRIERVGFGDVVRAAGTGGDERTWIAAAGFDAVLGAFDLGFEAELVQRTDPRLLLAEGDTAAVFVTAPGTFRRATATLRFGWRDRAARGLYLRAQASAQTALNEADSDLHRREAEVIPPLWGTARLGVRALDLFDGALDLDLALRGRGWTAFRGRRFHAPTALFALAELDDRPVDASGTLDVLAEAGIGGGRATVFVAYENALATRAYAGAYVVPVYPLPGPRLRFGVFWLLPN